MKFLKWMSILFVIVFMSFPLFSCKKQTSLVGEWQSEYRTLVFSQDGSCEICTDGLHVQTGTYTIDSDDELTITTDAGTQTIEYSLNNRSLMFNDTDYTKKR
jgi:hypothetical protein